MGMISANKRWHDMRLKIDLRADAVIDGEWMKSLSDHTYRNVTPIDGGSLGDVIDGQPAEIDLAVASSRACWLRGTWSRMERKAKKGVLIRIAELLMEHKNELALLETLDTGRPITDSLNVDIPLASECFQWYAEILDKRYDELISTADTNLIPILREPIGVVAAIVPWNFPLLMAAWKVAPALAVGNSVVLKPAPQSPLTATRLARIGVEAGLPPGALNVVPGHGEPAGKSLALHNDVDCVSFTGSVEVGKKLQQYAGMSNMKRVWVETGGKGPQVVFDDVEDLDTAASAIAWGVFYNQGQMCSAGSRAIVHRAIYAELIDKVVAIAEQLSPADPLDPETSIGAMINGVQVSRVHAYCRAANESAARVLTGGSPVDVISGGFYFEPTVVADVSRRDELFQEEVFGPVLSVTPIDSFEDAIATANDSRYGLTAAVWSQNVNTAIRAARAIRAGTVWINTFDRADFAVPFGGFGQSGFGRAKSLHAIEKYSDLKSIWLELN